MKFQFNGVNATPAKPVDVYPENVKVTSSETSGKIFLSISASNFNATNIGMVDADGSLKLIKVEEWVKKALPVTAEGYVKVSFEGKELKV